MDGWLSVAGESSLIDSKEFFKPIITPFELEMVLQGDEGRVWTGEWRADFQRLLEEADNRKNEGEAASGQEGGHADHDAHGACDGEINMDSEDEDEPPEYDLRTGKYISRSRPMQRNRPALQRPANGYANGATGHSTTLTKRSKGTLISVNGIASPAAEYLAQKRSWRGLGTDFEVKYEEDEEEIGDIIEEGRAGVARGYTVGEDESKT